MKTIGFIDYYLDEYHALHYPKWLNEASGGQLKVAYAYGQIDNPKGKSNNDVCKDLGIELLDSIEAVIEKSDCLMVLAPDHPDTHERLCRLPLASGKLTYVDKTFAPDRQTAINIINHAIAHNTPFFSTSALRFAKEYAEIDKSGIDFIAERGPGGIDNYLIHHLEPIICLMGHEVRRVMFNGTFATPAFTLEFADERRVSIAMLGWECDFGMAVNYRDGKTIVANSASDFYPRFISALADFFITGHVKVPAAETLQVISILEYARLAANSPGVWLDIPEINLKR